MEVNCALKEPVALKMVSKLLLYAANYTGIWLAIYSY